MKLVRFGKRVINMDQIVEIEYRQNPHLLGDVSYRLYTNQIIDGMLNWIEIEGADMIALEMWLEDNSEDARAPMMEEE